MQVKAPKKTRAKTAIVELASEIARKANEPMSIDEIKGRFQLELPFQVKHVGVGYIASVLRPINAGYTNCACGYKINMCGGRSYLVDKLDHAKGDSTTCPTCGNYYAHASIKQWVLV